MTHHVAVVGPGAKFHEAGLLVKGEELDIDLTRGLVDSWRLPGDPAIVVQHGLGHDGHLVVPVGTAEENISNEGKWREHKC